MGCLWNVLEWGGGRCQKRQLALAAPCYRVLRDGYSVTSVSPALYRWFRQLFGAAI